MSWIIFDDANLHLDGSSELSHLVIDDAETLTVTDSTSSFVVFNSSGEITTKVEDEPSSFIVFSQDEQIILISPTEGPDSLSITTGQGPKGDTGLTGIGTPGSTGMSGATGAVGPVGPAGPPGGTPEATSFVFHQSSVSAVWLITHNLGFVPNVMIIDSAGTRVEGTLVSVTNNSMTVSFAGAFSGIAYLS